MLVLLLQWVSGVGMLGPFRAAWDRKQSMQGKFAMIRQLLRARQFYVASGFWRRFKGDLFCSKFAPRDTKKKVAPQMAKFCIDKWILLAGDCSGGCCIFRLMRKWHRWKRLAGSAKSSSDQPAADLQSGLVLIAFPPLWNNTPCQIHAAQHVLGEGGEECTAYSKSRATFFDGFGPNENAKMPQTAAEPKAARRAEATAIQSREAGRVARQRSWVERSWIERCCNQQIPGDCLNA